MMKILSAEKIKRGGNVNVLPSLYLAFTYILSSYFSKILLQIYTPSPLPLYLL